MAETAPPAKGWRALQSGYMRPAQRFAEASWERLQPVCKPHLVNILPNMAGVRTDEQLGELLRRSRDSTVVVNFGSSWCTHCHKMFPAFVSLSKRFPQLKFAVAQIDYMHDAVRGMTYTPTFAIYHKRKKIDQFYGANDQQLRDHVWLHARAAGGGGTQDRAWLQAKVAAADSRQAQPPAAP